VNPAPKIGVLALQGDFREHAQALRSLEIESVLVRSAADFDGLAGLVIPGGESTTMSKLADTFGLWPSLHAARDRQLPMFGTCAGMIMLAKELVGARPDQHTIKALDITVRRNAFGRQVDSFETTVDLTPAGIEGFPGVFIRAPDVQGVGDGVELLAHLDDVQHAGTIVAVRQGNVLATAFHPELTADTRIHAYFVQMVRQVA
jgi:pyridoxal 5'-phosphate synthase pdxT subunit